MLVMSVYAQTARFILIGLSVCEDDIKMIGKTQNLRHTWKSLKAETDLEDPTSSVNQIRRQANENLEVVQSKSELSKRHTTPENTDENDLTKNISSSKRSLLTTYRSTPKCA